MRARHSCRSSFPGFRSDASVASDRQCDHVHGERWTCTLAWVSVGLCISCPLLMFYFLQHLGWMGYVRALPGSHLRSMVRSERDGMVNDLCCLSWVIGNPTCPQSLSGGFTQLPCGREFRFYLWGGVLVQSFNSSSSGVRAASSAASLCLEVRHCLGPVPSRRVLVAGQSRR